MGYVEWFMALRNMDDLEERQLDLGCLRSRSKVAGKYLSCSRYSSCLFALAHQLLFLCSSTTDTAVLNFLHNVSSQRFHVVTMVKRRSYFAISKFDFLFAEGQRLIGFQ